jgi:spoIIIJ-associated protein
MSIITEDDNARTYLEKMLAILDIDAQVFEEDIDESTTCLRIDCKASDAKLLIGRKGQTLEALQFLLRQMCRGPNRLEQPHFMLDVLNYRARRREQILDQAKEGAVAVLNGEAEEFDLQPMSAFERRTVHKYLQEHFPELSSDSRGQGEDRHIVISYVGLTEEDLEYGKAEEDDAEPAAATDKE